jgi:hypothetical protein
MNPTPTPSRAEAVLAAVLARFAAQVAPAGALTTNAPLAGVTVGPRLDIRGRKLPWLTIDGASIVRRLATADGQVENRIALDLTLDDAAHGASSRLAVGSRWAAWIESILVPEAERPAGPHFGGWVDAIEPAEIAFDGDDGGLGYDLLAIRARFQLIYRTDLGNPFTS